MADVLRYRRSDGREPFTEWLSSVRDKMAAARIRIRLRSIEAENFGDCASVGGGVMELRIHVGAGYRVYFGRHGSAVVILLCGGDTSSQVGDIEKARTYWLDWKGRQR